MTRPFSVAGFFAFRTPALPLAFLAPWSADLRAPAATGEALEAAVAADRTALVALLREAARRPELREALHLASPDLEGRVDLWLGGSMTEAQANRMTHSLLKYLVRMAHRPTPFGLFAGCSLGAWGEGTRLEVAAWREASRHTRLDMDALCTWAEGLQGDPAIRATRRYRPNPSLYEAAGRLRYTEVRPDPDQGRSYHLVALAPSSPLTATLARAAGGASLETLARPLAGGAISLEEAMAFVHALVDQQVLVSDLAPPLTGPEPVEGLIARLGAHPGTEPLARRLVKVQEALATLDAAGLGQSPAAYGRVAGILDDLPRPAHAAHLVQVDLIRAAPGARLGANVRRDLEAGVGLLHRLAPAPATDPLHRFKAGFRARFGSRPVPLLEALDPEAGLGFDGQGPGVEPPPFPTAPALPGRGAPSDSRLGARESWMLDRLWTFRDGQEWALTDEDLQALANPEPRPLPDAFAAMATILAPSAASVDAGDYRFILEHFAGPSGARLLGRFCHADPRLAALVKEYLAAEARLRPGVIFAEVVHLPEGWLGNVIIRPLLRDYEIPCLGVSGALPDRQIPLQDLVVSVTGDRVVLRSLSLGREVAPRLTTAHNHTRGLGVYRFLGALQGQGVASGTWDWGCLGSLPFLPRVRLGRQILARARWRFTARSFQPALEARGARAYDLLRGLREAHRLPRRVVLADGDQGLLVDLDSPLWAEAFLRLVAHRPEFLLTEALPGPEDLLAEGPEGRFCHELVVPFLARAEARGPEPGPAQSPFPSAIARAFPPGSEWLYLKVYSGASTADQLLVQDLAPLLEATRGLWDRWFFLRYADPEPHLRIRFHGDPGVLMGDLWPLLQRAFAQRLRDGWSWKLQLDTYDRELERYGGPTGMDLAEAWFRHDSETVLGLVRAYGGDDGAEVRWRLALAGVDTLLEDLGLDLEAKRRIVHGALATIRRERQADPALDPRLGAAFRPLRQDLDRLLGGHAQGPEAPGMALLAERSRSTAPCLGALREAELRGLLGRSRAVLALSFAHMHLNRLLRDAGPAQGRVVYHFLDRLYTSRLARLPKGQG